MAPNEQEASYEGVVVKGDVFVELKATLSLARVKYNSTPLEVHTELDLLMSTVALSDAVRDKILTYNVERIVHRPE